MASREAKRRILGPQNALAQHVETGRADISNIQCELGVTNGLSSVVSKQFEGRLFYVCNI